MRTVLRPVACGEVARQSVDTRPDPPLTAPDRTAGLRTPPPYPDTLAFHTSYSTVPSFTLEMLMLPDPNVHIHDYIEARQCHTESSHHEDELWQKLIGFPSA